MKYPPLSAVLFFFCIWQHHWRPLQSTFQAQGVTVVWCKSAKRIATQEGWKLWLKTIFSFGKALFPLVTRNGQGEPLISSTVPLTKPVLPHCSEESGKTWKQVDSCNIHPTISLKAGEEATSWNTQFLGLYYDDTLLVLLQTKIFPWILVSDCLWRSWPSVP